MHRDRLWIVALFLVVAAFALHAAGGSHTLFDNALAPSGVALKYVQPGLDGKAPFINVKAAPYLAACNASISDHGAAATDDLTPIQSAISSLSATGGTVVFPVGGCMVSDTITIPNRVHLVGAGMRETILMMKNGNNKDLFKNVGTDGWGASIQNMELYGNAFHVSNNPSGAQTSSRAIVWNGDAANDGPALFLENVYITEWYGGGASNLFEATVFTGNLWVHGVNVRIFNNRWARGMYLKTSDSLFTGLYMSNNGGSQGVEDLVVEGGAANRFVGCYLGGGSGREELLIKGSSYNTFSGCIVDSCWTNCVRFIDGGGATASTYNAFIGGMITNPGRAATNTSDHVVFENASTKNNFIGTVFDNNSGNVGRYALTEMNTAANNSCSACRFGTFGTGVNNLRPSTSRITESPGYNPQGVASITVTASPFTYTNNDNVPENIYMSGGTVSSVVKNAITIYASSPNDMWLEPGEAVTVTYTVIPTMVKDRK